MYKLTLSAQVYSVCNMKVKIHAACLYVLCVCACMCVCVRACVHVTVYQCHSAHVRMISSWFYLAYGNEMPLDRETSLVLLTEPATMLSPPSDVVSQ